MSTLAVIFLVALAVIAVGAVAFVASERRRTAALVGRFGPEYHRLVSEIGDRRRAERVLTGRAARVERLAIRPLSREDSARFAAEWRRVQGRFVDDPGGAVDEASGVVNALMRLRGYPVADFEQRAADLSVDHARVVGSYRAAQIIVRKRARGDATTEELRSAIVHFRALFEELLETRRGRGGDGARGEAAG
jgi:hypothetical protein